MKILSAITMKSDRDYLLIKSRDKKGNPKEYAFADDDCFDGMALDTVSLAVFNTFKDALKVRITLDLPEWQHQSVKEQREHVLYDEETKCYSIYNDVKDIFHKAGIAEDDMAGKIDERRDEADEIENDHLEVVKSFLREPDTENIENVLEAIETFERRYA